MNNKTLIFSSSENIWGGGQIYIEQLCNYLNNKNLESYILSPEPEKFKCKSKKMVSMKSKKDRLINTVKLARKLKEDGFNTVILNDLSSLWLAPIFKFFGYQTISLLHLFLQKRSENPLGHSIFEYNLLKFSSYFCDNIFSVNKNNQKVFGEKVNFIGNYVPDWFFESEKNINSGKYDFIMIGRFAKQKNIPLFLEILSELNKYTSKKYTALLVGDGPEKETVFNKIKDLNLEDSITMQDWVIRDELPQVFDLGKCFVLSSHHEGFATTLLESHARGIPAISTISAGFCAEFIDGFNAKTGLTYNPEDINKDEFLSSLAKLIETYKDYENISLEKAKIYSADNVLGPIHNSISIRK